MDAYSQHQVDARFIGGTGRSGTSILGKLMAYVPHLRYFAEPKLVNDQRGICGLISGNAGPDQFRQFVHERRSRIVPVSITHRAGSYQPYYTPEILDAVMSMAFSVKDKLHSYRLLLEGIYKQGWQESGDRYWVDKSPGTVKLVHVLYELFPNMRYVHIIREPKDVYASVKAQKWGPTDVNEFISWYNDILTEAKKSKAGVPEGQYFVISLESLLEDAEHELRRVMDFFELEANDQVIRKCTSRISGGRMHNKRWEQDISAEEASMINRECYEMYSYWRQCEVQCRKRSNQTLTAGAS